MTKPRVREGVAGDFMLASTVSRGVESGGTAREGLVVAGLAALVPDWGPGGKGGLMRARNRNDLLSILTRVPKWPGKAIQGASRANQAP